MEELVLKPRWFYRIEAISPDKGLWYNDHTDWVFDEGIALTKNSSSIELPMDYDPRYRKDGRLWHSACEDKEKMKYWFDPVDAHYLLSNGYRLYRYLATEYHIYENEVCFIKATALKRIPLAPEVVFGRLESGALLP